MLDFLSAEVWFLPQSAWWPPAHNGHLHACAIWQETKNTREVFFSEKREAVREEQSRVGAGLAPARCPQQHQITPRPIGKGRITGLPFGGSQEESFPSLFQLPELPRFLGSWPLSPSSKPGQRAEPLSCLHPSGSSSPTGLPLSLERTP